MRGLTDIHCHLVPGVDDGAENLSEALKVLKMEYEQGVRRVIVTPHHRRGMFETSRAVMERQFQKLKKEAELLGMDLYLGCEYHSESSMVSDFQEKVFPTMAGTKFVLAEFSSNHSFSQVRSRIYELVVGGYRPIIAHIERYPQVVAKTAYVEELRDLGAYIQMNADSILGRDGWRLKWQCRKLLKLELIDFVGSDAHDTTERPPHLQECYEYMKKKYKKDYVQRIFEENPDEIFQR